MSAVVIQSLIGVGGMLLAVILSAIINAISPKSKRKGQEGNKVDNKDSGVDCKVDSKVLKNSPVTINTDKLIEFIEVAESHPNFNSLEKLDFVLTSYHQYCIDNNFKYVKDVIEECITKLIDMTKKVNKRPKDEESELKVNI